MQYKQIIWDWNGTLLNDVWLTIEIVNDLLKNHNQRVLNLETYRDIFDFPVRLYYERAGFDFNKESFEYLCEKFMGQYHHRVMECVLHTEARMVLNHLSQKGYQHAVLSAAEQNSLDMMVNHFQVRPFFTEVVGLSDYYARSKVENGLTMLQKMEVAPQEVVFIGDTFHDYEVAERMSVDCILIPQGHHSLQKLQCSKAKVVDSLAELLSLL